MEGSATMTAAIAAAAEAPQIATAPAVKTPNRRRRPVKEAQISPNTMVRVTAHATPSIVRNPRPIICSNVMRAPSKATPIRRMERDDSPTPGAKRDSAEMKLKAIPRSSANRTVGPPYTFETKVAAIPTVMLSRTPGPFRASLSRAPSRTSLIQNFALRRDPLGEAFATLAASCDTPGRLHPAGV